MKKLIISCSILLTACQQTAFTSASREEILSHNSVMGDASGALNQPGKEDLDPMARYLAQFEIHPDGTAGDIKQPPYFSQPGSTSLPIDRMCSDSYSNITVPYQRAIANGHPVELRINDRTCSKDKLALDVLVKGNAVTIDQLKSLCPSAVPTKGLLIVKLYVAGGTWGQELTTLPIVWDIRNPADDTYCSRRVSPLVVHVGESFSPIALSSLNDGILFDILGERNNHKKVRIGWFTNTEYRLLALPNAAGEVNGADQLFGDVARGPDGKVADNGYAALAKYDGTTADGVFQIARPDGVIDNHDPVFAHLRLFTDRNFDGVAQADELESLTDVGISSIDLNYDEHYAERDRHGNEIKYKSVVNFEDGRLDLIFDLYFIYR